MRSFVKGFFKLLLWVVGILLVFMAVMRIFFVDMAVVGHNAMAPTLEAGDTILVWRNAEPDQLGEIAICDHPVNPGQLVMGRVVAKGGVTIETDRHQQLVVGGSSPDLDWQGEETFTDTVEERTDRYTRGLVDFGRVDHLIYHRVGGTFRLRSEEVPSGKIYLLSDNRMHVGQDSRYFGAIDPATCHGTVFMRLAPPSDSPNDLGHTYLDLVD